MAEEQRSRCGDGHASLAYEELVTSLNHVYTRGGVLSILLILEELLFRVLKLATAEELIL
jgi:hypothetical protein